MSGPLGLSPRQAVVLTLLTLVWGLNWPVMKAGVSQMPPLSFRAASLVLGLPCLGLAMWWMRQPLALPRHHWGRVLHLSVTNMLVWHVVLMLALPHLSSGRAAILAYTMPVFSALWGRWAFGERLTARQIMGVAATGAAVALLLWHELSRLSGAPLAALCVLGAAALWGLGTQQMRRLPADLPGLALTFWMTAVTMAVVCALAWALEGPHLAWPGTPTALAVLYNAVLIFGFSQAAWQFLARTLPPVASSISVMLIPVLGIGSGAVFLGETLHWQDGAAVALILLAIAAVLVPGRGARPKA